MKNILLYLTVALAASAATTSCIEDSFSSSPSDQPAFSVDTLRMGVIYTDDRSATHRFTVYNRASKSISISDISLSGDNAPYFRLNVDGFSGSRFNNVEIRAKDSIFVFVDALLPESGSDTPLDICADIDFTTNGVTRSVTIDAEGQDLVRLKALEVTEDMTLTAGKPYRIIDSLVVAPGVTLNLDPGARLLFHDKAYLAVEGRLVSRGTLDAPVTISGDRVGNVAADIPFDLMSRQWEGIVLRPSSTHSELSFTTIKNSSWGVVIYGSPQCNSLPSLKMTNCRLRNSGGLVLTAEHADIEAYGCEFAEAADGLVSLTGGTHRFCQSTFSNNYLFTAIGGAAITLGHLGPDTDDLSNLPYTAARFDNSIIYGIGADIAPGDLIGTGVVFRNCLIRSAGTDDDNFISCLWDADPLFYTVRTDYLFDYRLRDGSPAIGAGNPDLVAPEAATDAYGLDRGAAPDLGAYVYVPADIEQRLQP